MLGLDLQQTWPWKEDRGEWVHLYADARGAPARVAAVLLIDGRTIFCDMAPSERLLAIFRTRADNQILGQEMLAIALGLSSFAALLTNRRVVIWSDNVGAEAATRSGRAKEFDHASLAHCLWLKLAALRAEAFVKRVPSKYNIADSPSREEYGLLGITGALHVEAVMDEMFYNPSSWDSLSLVGKACDQRACL